MRVRRWTTAVVVVGAAAVTTACSGEVRDNTSPDLVTAPIVALMDPENETVRYELEADGPDRLGDLRVTGQIDLVDGVTWGVRDEMFDENGEADAHVIVDDDRLILHRSLIPSSWFPVAGWVGIDPSQDVEAVKSLASDNPEALWLANLVPVTAPSFPGDVFDLIADFATSVERNGSDEVRSVESDRYRVRLDERGYRQRLGEILESTAVDLRDEELERFVEQALVPSVQVWIDEQGTVRQIRMAFDPSLIASKRSQEESVTVTLEFFDVGGEMDVELPGAANVTRASEMDLAAEFGVPSSDDPVFDQCVRDFLDDVPLDELAEDPEGVAAAAAEECLGVG